MNKLKSTLAATLLSFALTITAAAGDISSPGVTQPPPPPPATMSTDIGIADTTDSEDVGSSELPFEILLALLSIF